MFHCSLCITDRSSRQQHVLSYILRLFKTSLTTVPLGYSKPTILLIPPQRPEVHHVPPSTPTGKFHLDVLEDSWWSPGSNVVPVLPGLRSLLAMQKAGDALPPEIVEAYMQVREVFLASARAWTALTPQEIVRPRKWWRTLKTEAPAYSC